MSVVQRFGWLRGCWQNGAGIVRSTIYIVYSSWGVLGICMHVHVDLTVWLTG